jgi:predicted dehydrogenase
MESLLADVTTFVPGRRIDDDANLLVRYRGGARGIVYCSQVSVGEENGLRLRVYGTEAGLEWRQEEPNMLRFRPAEGPERVLRRGNAYLSPEAKHGTRLPSGHPEAFFEAFANVYANAIRTMQARRAGRAPDPLDLDFPTVQDGARGVHFVQTALTSGRAGGTWVNAAYTPPGNNGAGG